MLKENFVGNHQCFHLSYFYLLLMIFIGKQFFARSRVNSTRFSQLQCNFYSSEKKNLFKSLNRLNLCKFVQANSRGSTVSQICLQFTETLSVSLMISMPGILILFYMYSAFEDLNEAYDALINDESIEGMMEEVFTAMEYIKKRNNPLLSVVHFFEEKHGYGVAFKSNPFWEESNLDNCIKKVVQFIVKDDKYAVISKFDGDIKV